MTDERAPIWVPDPLTVAQANVTGFAEWLGARHKLHLADYHALWAWSTTNIELFWAAIWDYFEIKSERPEMVLADRGMPGAEWFPGARLNYAEQLLRRAGTAGPAILHADERLELRSISRETLIDQVLRVATQLRALGVKPGDRVAACLPNRPEAMIAMLAAASVGAIWSIVSPEAGVDGVLDRFSQIEPELLFVTDSYRFNGRMMDRRAEAEALAAGLPTLKHVIWVPGSESANPLSIPALISWDDMLEAAGAQPALDAFPFEQVSFTHPLWILFSSGTTGLPKALAHSHGGMLLEQLKCMAFQLDLKPGDRIFFYTITGWMMWNFLVGSMLAGATPVLFEGHPTQPDVGILWRVAALSEAAVFGGSPSYVKLMQQADYRPSSENDFPKLRAVLLSGSPASAECMQWFLDAVKPNLWVQSGSGGTDICSGFVGGTPILPVYAGEIQARCLGVAAHAFDEDGHPLIDEVGELVITEPMPSMPVCFWGDDDGSKYHSAYFDTYPGIWRHGDFFRINRRGGCFVLGRSDATLNRHGVRIGTAEIYRSLEQLAGIADSLIVNIDLPDGEFWMPLFVKLADGVRLDGALEQRIRVHLRSTLSPRHVPDEILSVADIPYTVTGKRLEVPVRRILMGTPIEQAVGKGTAHNLGALAYFVELAAERAGILTKPPTDTSGARTEPSGN